jgi:hypothetical protein
MADRTGRRAATGTSRAGRRGSANAWRVDPLGLEMFKVFFWSGGLVVAICLGFCSCQRSAHTNTKILDLLGSLYCSLMRMTSSICSLSRALCTTIKSSYSLLVLEV